MMIQRQFSRIVHKFCNVTNMIQRSSIEREAHLKKLQENAYVEYKKYPSLPHQDPSSPDYIHSELDEYHDKVKVQAYNQVIDNFKNDLAVQRKVWDAISNLDRPYKRGIPGIDRNLNPDGPSKPYLEDLGFERRDDPNYDFKSFANADRFISNTPFHMKHGYDHYIQWQEERRNRPVTHHFNHGKGYKYDVPVKEADKYDYVSDRLGHQEFIGHPVDRLFRLEKDIYHPAYFDQPFVKMPGPNPSKSLNFEAGEVLYENTKVLEWLKFWQLTVFSSGAFFAVFVPFNMLFKTNLITNGADQLLKTTYHLVSPNNVDIFRLGIPISLGAVAYTVYALLNFTNAITRQYIIKATYSKDKQLLFVKRIDVHGVIYEEAYEMAHLQIVPPSQKSAVGDLSSQDQDGIWRITSMNNQRIMLMYNDPLHWNSQLRDEFFKRTLGMWDKSYYGYNRQEAEENEHAWQQEVRNDFERKSLPK